MTPPIQEPFTGNPAYRFALRARIATAGFRTLRDFGKEIGFDAPKMSRIICGWELPNAKMCAAMAEKLKMSMDELVKML